MERRYHKLMDDMEDHTPEEAYKVIEDEIEKLAGLESSSAEFNVTRNYLDWLTSLPWKKQSEERLDLAHAKTVSHAFDSFDFNSISQLCIVLSRGVAVQSEHAAQLLETFLHVEKS